jgi:hypothetical protein
MKNMFVRDTEMFRSKITSRVCDWSSDCICLKSFLVLYVTYRDFDPLDANKDLVNETCRDIVLVFTSFIRLRTLLRVIRASSLLSRSCNEHPTTPPQGGGAVVREASEH